MSCCVNFSFNESVFFKSARFLDVVLCASKLEEEDIRFYLACCLWIAIKLEHGHVDFLSSFSEEEEKLRIVKAEPVILKLLNYRLDYHTVDFFLRRLIEAVSADKHMIITAYFFCDVSTLMLSMLDYAPSTIAATSMCLAKVVNGEICPLTTILEYAHLDNVQEIKLCAQMILSEAFDIRARKEDTIYEKYTKNQKVVDIEKLNLDSTVLSNI